MDIIEAHAFAQRWVEGWNRHDLERVLAHFSDDVVFSSPFIAQLTEDPSGTVRGKDALRSYWRAGLDRFPDLRFEVTGVYVGVDTVAIQYRNQVGRAVVEVFTVEGDLATSGAALYGPE
jgi:ketosteroid isomerase-like protein